MVDYFVWKLKFALFDPKLKKLNQLQEKDLNEGISEPSFKLNVSGHIL